MSAWSVALYANAAAMWLAVIVLAVRCRRPRVDVAPLRPARAAAYVITGWALLFGLSTISAFAYLLEPRELALYSTADSFGRQLAARYVPRTLFALLALAVAGRAVSASGRMLALPTGRRAVRQTTALAIVCMLAVILSFDLAYLLLPTSGSPWAREPAAGVHAWVIVDAIVSSADAAISEELVLVVVPVLLLRAAGVRTAWLVALLLALRLSFHVYYGWPSLSVLLWGSLFLALYLAWGWVWPQLIAHFAYDVINGAFALAPEWMAAAAWLVVLGVGACYLAAPLWQVRRQQRAGFTGWIAAGGAAQLNAAVAGATGRPVAVVVKRGAWRMLSLRAHDGRYQVVVGPGVQHLGSPELLVLAARVAAEIRLGHPDAERAAREGDWVWAVAASTAPAVGGAMFVRFGATAGLWSTALIVAAVAGWLWRPASRVGAQSRRRVLAADRAVAEDVGMPALVRLLSRFRDLEGPTAWVAGRGISADVPAAQRLSHARPGGSAGIAR